VSPSRSPANPRPTNPTGAERRRAPRAPATFPLRFGAERAPATLRDISSLGLCCETSAAVDEMTAVRIELEVPVTAGGAQPSPLRVAGAVVRCELIVGSKPSRYEVAVFFTEIDEADRRQLASYVGRQFLQS
jgi:hypothetical protein